MAHDFTDFYMSALRVLSKVSSSCLQDYGEVPEYLHQRSEEEQRAQEAYDNYVQEQKERGAMKHLSDEERRAVLEVLEHLATHWHISLKNAVELMTVQVFNRIPPSKN